MLGRIWTISTILSLSRIILLAPVSYLLLLDAAQYRYWVAALMIVAAATDFFDGYLARKLHEVTEFGKIIDPIADKIAAGGSAFVLVIVGLLPLWYIVVILLRDVMIVLGGIYIHSKKKVITQSNWPGKFAVSFVALVLLFSVLQEPALEWMRELCIWVSVAIMAFSLVLYARRLFIGASTMEKENS